MSDLGLPNITMLSRLSMLP